MNQRTQLTHEQYQGLTRAERMNATREGRADTILGRKTPPQLTDYPDDHQLTMDDYRAMPLDQRHEALRTGRMDHIRKPQHTNQENNNA